MAAPEPDYYDILGVAPTAGADEIRRAFRARARRYHPDVNKEPDAARRFQLAHDAYDILGDPTKRRAYDAGRARPASRPARTPPAGSAGARPRRAASPPPSAGAGSAADGIFSDLDDILSSLGGTTPKQTARAQAPSRPAHSPRDIDATVTISLDEAARGLTRRVTVERDEPCLLCHGAGDAGGPRLAPCAACHGTGFAAPGPGGKPRACPRCAGVGEVFTSTCAGCAGTGRVRAPHTLEVTIPAGIADGQRIRLAGQGQRAAPGSAPGDLYLTVRVRPHHALERRGDDVHSRFHLTPAQARDGARVDVRTLYGRVSLAIPPGTADGVTFRLRGQGFPQREGGKGDQLARAHVSAAPDEPGGATLRAWTRRARRRLGSRLGPLKRTLAKRLRPR